MNISLIKKGFSYSLLLAYSMVVFDQGVLDGIHFLSHASEVFSNSYSFHSHGNGEYHVHHHNFMETMESVFGREDKGKKQQDPQIPFQQQIKLHVPALFSTNLWSIPIQSLHFSPLTRNLESMYPEVNTPPPKAFF